MSATINQVQLIGRLGRVGDLRHTPKGTPILRASLATDAANNSVDWHELVFWSDLATIVAKHARKGRLVFVAGALKVRTYVDRGENRRWVDVNVQRLLYLDAPSKAAETAEPTASPTPPEDDIEALAAEAEAAASDLGALA